MNTAFTETDDVQFSEPIKAQKNVRCGITFAEKVTWKNKVDGQEYDALKLTLQISDDSVTTEHDDAKPKLTIEDQFNLVQYPYTDKKTGQVKKLGRQKLFQLEKAFGFDPIFQVEGQPVEPFVTRNGNKVAPKIAGVGQILNPDFASAYFSESRTPDLNNWVGKTLYANIGVETSEQYGSKNIVEAYVKAPQI